MAVAPKRARKRGRNDQRRRAPGLIDDVLVMAGMMITQLLQTRGSSAQEARRSPRRLSAEDGDAG